MSKVNRGGKGQAVLSKKKQVQPESESEGSFEDQEDFDQSESHEETPQTARKPARGGKNAAVAVARTPAPAKVPTKVAPKPEGTERASKTSQRFSGIESEPKSQTGLIYVGHLPYGFVEEGLKQYFEQYGDVLRVKLMRSKKTARSKGYCFIEFKEPEVAKIAAHSMNGYLMYGRPLVCQYIEQSSRHKHQLIRADRKFKFVPWQVIYRKALNKEDKTDDQVVKSLANLIQGDKRKSERLKELGIKFEFKQYKDL